MSPAHAILNPADMVLKNAVVSGDFVLLAWIVSYCKNLLCGQLGGSTLFASIGSAVLNAVHLVSGCCVPPQVGKSVVRWVTIVMAAFMPFRWFSDKSKKNESMNAYRLGLVSRPQKHKRPLVALGNRGCFQAVSTGIAHATKIRDFVTSLKPNYRLPVFHTTTIPMYGIKVNGS